MKDAYMFPVLHHDSDIKQNNVFETYYDLKSAPQAEHHDDFKSIIWD